eukprot:s6371_g4.t1
MDIPYVRAGSQKSVPHDDEFAVKIKAMFDKETEDGDKATSSDLANAAAAMPAESGDAVDDDEGDAVPGDPPDDVVPDDAPDEEVPASESGRPPDPPIAEGRRERADDDEREIEVEGEGGAPVRKAKIGTLKAEAKTLAHLCTHRYRNPYCEACIRAKMKHYRTERGAFKRELKAWGDLITFDFLDMRKAADAVPHLVSCQKSNFLVIDPRCIFIQHLDVLDLVREDVILGFDQCRNRQQRRCR